MAWPSAWRGFDITTNMLKATSWIQRRSMWLPKVPEPHAVRRNTARDRPSLFRWYFNLLEPRGSRGAGRHRRSARADVGEALPRRCRVDSSERHPGTIAKVPSMSDCLLCDWNRNRNFNVNRDLRANGAGGAVCGIAVVFCSQPRAALHRAARENTLRTRNIHPRCDEC